MSIYVPSMWGSEPGNINSNWAVQPLQDYNFVDWWMHGTKSLNDPPGADNITQLPAGGTFDFEITGNKAFTSMGRGLWVKNGSTPRNIPDPWSNGMGGGSANIHAELHSEVAGCAIGIAYKSNVNDVLPTDFVIVSVVQDCISRQLQTFDFPALPACPNGKCICSWFWIHNSVGGTDQNYMTPFQCNIVNPSTFKIGMPGVPSRCDGEVSCYLYPKWGNITKTCPKAQNPMYWANNQGNNMMNPTNAQCAPVYNDSYGFPDGAQNQIFTNLPPTPAGSMGDTLFSGSSLSSSAATILVSPGFRTKLVMQGDGNAVLSDLNGNTVHWTSNTAGKGVGPYRLTMQADGNLVITDSTSGTIWSSGTGGQGWVPYRLKLRDLVTLVIVDTNSTPLWSAKTTA